MKKPNARVKPNKDLQIRKVEKIPVVVLPKEKPPINWIERQVLKLFIRSLIKKIENMKGSWKTALAGWLALVAALAVAAIALIDGDPATKPDAQQILDALQAVGIGVPLWLLGLFARDKNVSSQAQAEAGTNVK